MQVIKNNNDEKKEILDVRYTRSKKDLIDKVNTLKKFLKITDNTKLFDFLITEKYQEIELKKIGDKNRRK